MRLSGPVLAQEPPQTNRYPPMSLMLSPGSKGGSSISASLLDSLRTWTERDTHMGRRRWHTQAACSHPATGRWDSQTASEGPVLTAAQGWMSRPGAKVVVRRQNQDSSVTESGMWLWNPGWEWGILRFRCPGPRIE